MPHGSGNAFKQTLSRKKARDVKQRRLAEIKLGYTYKENKTEYNFPELSQEELEKLKIDIRKKIRTQNKIKTFTLISLTIIAMIVLFYFLLK